MQIENKIIPLFSLYFLLFFAFTQFLASSKILKGRLFSSMEPCTSPIVQIIFNSESNVTDIIPKLNPIPSDNQSPLGGFQIDVPWKENGPNGNLTLEAVSHQLFSIFKKINSKECPPKKTSESIKKLIYNLELDKIDWEGANELLLFNDVHILALGYPLAQRIGMA